MGKMLEEITVKIDGKTYFDLLRKAQLYDELGEPDNVEELIGRIYVLEDQLKRYDTTDHTPVIQWVMDSTAPVPPAHPPAGEVADSFSDCINGDPFKDY